MQQLVARREADVARAQNLKRYISYHSSLRVFLQKGQGIVGRVYLASHSDVRRSTWRRIRLRITLYASTALSLRNTATPLDLGRLFSLERIKRAERAKTTFCHCMICIKHICGALLLPPVTRCSSQPDRSHCIAKTTASLLQQCHHIITQDSTTTRRSSKNRQQQPLLLLHHRLFPLILKSRYHANINLFPFAAAAAAESLRLPATTIAPPGDDDDDAALSLDWALLLPGEMCVTRNETSPYAGNAVVMYSL